MSGEVYYQVVDGAIYARSARVVVQLAEQQQETLAQADGATQVESAGGVVEDNDAVSQDE